MPKINLISKVVIVGAEGVGKTTLMSHLLGKPVSEEERDMLTLRGLCDRGSREKGEGISVESSLYTLDVRLREPLRNYHIKKEKMSDLEKIMDDPFFGYSLVDPEDPPPIDEARGKQRDYHYALRDANVVMIVFDKSSLYSYDAIKACFNDALIDCENNDTQVIIVQNKSDKRWRAFPRKRNLADINRWRRENNGLNISCSYHEVSALTGEGLPALYHAIIHGNPTVQKIILESEEWRPRNHHRLPTKYRAAMRALCILGKARREDPAELKENDMNPASAANFG